MSSEMRSSMLVEDEVKGRKRRVEDVVVVEHNEVDTEGPVVKEDQRINLPVEKQVDLVLNLRKQEYLCERCSKTFGTISECSNHYAAKHMHKCETCRKELPTSHLLELHVLEVHDSFFALMAERKPMYSCLAEECQLKFLTPEERYSHSREEHKQHELHRAFQHFENIHKKKPNTKSTTNKNRGKNAQKKVVGTAEMETDDLPENVMVSAPVDGSGDAPAKSVVMEVDANAVQEKKVVETIRSGSKTNSKAGISFGRHTTKFVPNSWHTASTVGGTKSKRTENSEAILDMASVQQMLPEVNPAKEDN